jgi:hypothetical protein
LILPLSTLFALALSFDLPYNGGAGFIPALPGGTSTHDASGTIISGNGNTNNILEFCKS